MAQGILRPDDQPTGSIVLTSPASPIENTLKKVVDLSQLMPGDLILVSSIAPDWVGRMIRSVQQKGGHQSEHARWEHAAVYIGYGVICEATRVGVSRAMLSKFAATHNIRARRDPALTTDQRYELVIQALTKSSIPYSFRDIFKLWRHSKWGFNNVKNSNQAMLEPQYPKRATICSQLYADCYVHVTSRVLGNLKDGISTPAALSATNTLIDVPLNWLTISSEDNEDHAGAARQFNNFYWWLSIAAALAAMAGVFFWLV